MKKLQIISVCGYDKRTALKPSLDRKKKQQRNE